MVTITLGEAGETLAVQEEEGMMTNTVRCYERHLHVEATVTTTVTGNTTMIATGAVHARPLIAITAIAAHLP